MLTKELVLTSVSDKKDENTPLETNYTLTIGHDGSYSGWGSYGSLVFGSITPIPDSFTAFYEYISDNELVSSLNTSVETYKPFDGYFGVSEFDNSYYRYSTNYDLGKDIYQPLNLLDKHIGETFHVWISDEKPSGGKEVIGFTKGEGTYTLECDTINVPCQYLRIRYNGDPSYKAWFNFSMEYEPEQNGYHVIYEKHGRLVFDRLRDFFDIGGHYKLELENQANWYSLPFLVYFFNEKISFNNDVNDVRCVFPTSMMLEIAKENLGDIDFWFGDIKVDFTFVPSSSDNLLPISGDLDLTALHGKLRDSITLPLP